MNIYKLIILLAIPQIACMQTAARLPEPTAVIQKVAVYQSPTNAAPEIEIASGEVYEIPTVAPTPEPLCVIAQVAVHLRAEPSAKSNVTNWLQAGTPVTKLHSADGWTLAQVGEQSGYIKSEYLGECVK